MCFPSCPKKKTLYFENLCKCVEEKKIIVNIDFIVVVVAIVTVIFINITYTQVTF